MDYNARYYDPALGRFISADTIIPQPGNPLAWDRYAYGRNNPINYTDPSGHFAVPVFIVTGGIGAGVGALIGGITYSLTNQESFNRGEFWTAVGAGAVSGALIGSGLGLISAATSTATVAAGASMAIGAGSASAVTEIEYMATSQEGFESEAFLESAAISGAVGGVSSVCPMTTLGVAAKGLTNIAGAELQYAVQTENWTVEGAQQAAVYGTLGAAFDVGVNSWLSSTFVMDNPLSNIYPGRSPSGYILQSDILQTAALSRAQTATGEAIGNILSGFGAAASNRYVRRNILE